MSKIVFFSIPAHGHTNPTIPVVYELVQKGHEVWYYSFLEFQEKIEGAGATFIPCDEYLPKVSQEEIDRKAGKDFAALIEMVVDTTISLDEKVCADLKKSKPDCIVSDSLCFWGKLFAMKLGIPYFCSTTSFAFNQYTAKLMKPGFIEMTRMIVGMPRINKKLKLLRDHGYEVDNFVSIIQNDNDTNTVVYTSKEFQPMVETFSDKYAFVGPSIRMSSEVIEAKNDKKLIYISLGTVLNQNIKFYQNCMKAFEDKEYEVVVSVGKRIEISSLGHIPDNFVIKNEVDQIAILQKADIFITHCGMNSVNESLYYGVPMVLYPLHSEQRVVANRVSELGAGMKLKRMRTKNLAEAVETVLADSKYLKNAEKISDTFQIAGGARKAADFILSNLE
ncbi:macrolide family glycosyltransferase [Oceanobacillus bengalensis]|uniref:Glucosyltransferase n=1 Tax=Oceanobacillus bengalensis TaxID=1435466 RepID=A0A494Z7H4_9BACI|nr:macrolide family glycosyltransferase [Oceanobacillus bengalensis]RKQ18551.1 glucosyltransferase [Oceanobacillus bengalensis]